MSTVFNFRKLWSELSVPTELVDRHPAIIEAMGKLSVLREVLAGSEASQAETRAELETITGEVCSLRVLVALGEAKPSELEKAEKGARSLRSELEAIGATILAQSQAIAVLGSRKAEAIERVQAEIGAEIGAKGAEAIESFCKLYSEAMQAFSQVVRVHKTMSANGLANGREMYNHDYPTFPELGEVAYLAYARNTFTRG